MALRFLSAATMPDIRTHYDTLKVPRDAPIEVINAAYRSLAREYHPDRRGDSPESLAAMQALNAAYDALKNPLTRAEHDRWIESELGADFFENPPPNDDSSDAMEYTLVRNQPSTPAKPTNTFRAVLSALLSIGYAVAALTLIAIPDARIVGILMLLGGWVYYLNHHPRQRR